MKEAVTKVIDTLTQEEFDGAFQKLLEQYNKCIAAGVCTIKSKFQKILVENTTVIAHKINKLQLQILEALHIKTKKKPQINRINFENSGKVFKCL